MITVKWLEGKLNKPQEKEIVKAHKYGLYARVRKTGSISFIYRFMWEGKREKQTIGSFPKIKLADAVAIAENHNLQVAKNKHPAREAKINRAKINNEHSVKSLAQKWLGFHFDDHPDKAKSKGTPHNVLRSLEIHVFPVVGHVPWEGLDRAEWSDLFIKIKKRAPSISSRLVTTIKQIASFALQNGITKHHPLLEYSAKNSLGIAKGRGHRVFSDDEIFKINETMNISQMKESNKILFKLMFIYGCRTQELRLCEPKHLNFEKNVWIVPRELNKPKDKKNISLTKPIVRPLFEETVALFKQAILLNPNSAWVFPKERRTTIDEPVSATAMLDIPKNIRLKILDKYPSYTMEKWTKHDVRRTLRTRMANIVPRDVAESMLGHVLGGTEDHYNHNDFFDEKLIGYKKWYAILEDIWGKDDNDIKFGA
jgi:integrase